MSDNNTHLVVSQSEYDYINGIITTNDIIIIEGITFVKRERVIDMLGKFATEHAANISAELTALHTSYDKLVSENLKQSQELAKLRDLVHNPRHKQ
jgi:hypothetical protein